MLEDSISPLERQLYFKTAHAHFKAGCPALALEVLSKLPSKIMDPSTEQSNSKYIYIKLILLNHLTIFNLLLITSWSKRLHFFTYLIKHIFYISTIDTQYTF